MPDQPDLGALFGVAADSSTFLGLAPCPDLEALTAPIAILGVPCATPYRSVGAYCRNAPDALRQATGALTANVDRHDFDSGGAVFPTPQTRAVDCGDLPFDEADGTGNRDVIRAAVAKILERGANARISIDLEKQEIRGPDGGMIHFDIDPFRKHCLINGLDDIGLTMERSGEITGFETKLATERPWA